MKAKTNQMPLLADSRAGLARVSLLKHRRLAKAVLCEAMGSFGKVRRLLLSAVRAQLLESLLPPAALQPQTVSDLGDLYAELFTDRTSPDDPEILPQERRRAPSKVIISTEGVDGAAQAVEALIECLALRFERKAALAEIVVIQTLAKPRVSATSCILRSNDVRRMATFN